MAKTYSAGVKEYRETYWMPDYTPKDTDILARLKIPPSPGYRAKKRPLPWRQSPRPVPGPRSGPTFSPTWIITKAAPLGRIDIMRDSYIREDRSRGIFFDQDWGSMPGVFPVASGGIHVWHMPALVTIFDDDPCLQFGGGTLGHPWGNAAGAAANRVALEACVEDRNRNGAEGLEKRGGDVLRDAARSSPELDAAVGSFF